MVFVSLQINADIKHQSRTIEPPAAHNDSWITSGFWYEGHMARQRCVKYTRRALEKKVERQPDVPQWLESISKDHLQLIYILDDSTGIGFFSL